MQNEDLLKQYTRTMDKAGGMMDKLADIQIRGLAGSLEELHASFQIMQEQFMDPRAIGAVTKHTQSFSMLLEKLGKLSPATKYFIDKMVVLGIILGPVIMSIGRVIIMFGLLMKFVKLGAMIRGIGLAFRFLSTSMFGWIGIAITAGVIIDRLYNKYEKFKKLVDKIWRATPGLQMFPGYGTLRAIREKALGGLESALLGAPAAGGAGAARMTLHPLTMQQQVAHALHININDKNKNIESIYSTSKNAKISTNSTGLNMAYSRIY